MGIFDQILSRKKQVDTTVYRLLSGAGSSSGIKIHSDQDKLFKLFESCGVNYDPKDSETILKLSRMAYDVFPFVRRAIKDISAMVGNLEVVAAEGQTVSESMIDRINKELSELPILNEFDWLNPHERGMNSLVYRVIRTGLRDGLACMEERFDEETLEHLGVLLFDSENFDYIRDDESPWKLRYRVDQFPDMESGFFHTYGYEYSNERPWPNPLVAGGGFYMHILTAILIAIRNINARKGAPVEIGMITVKDDGKLTNPKTLEQYSKVIDQLHKETEKAIRKQNEGRSTKIIADVPMDIDFISKSFGVEGLDEVDKDILGLVLMGFANLLEIPYEFIGQVLGSTGFSPERFKILWKIWGAKVDNIRESVKPKLLAITRNYLRSVGIPAPVIERIDLDFVMPEVVDEMEQAETENMIAEANLKHTQVANFLAQIDTVQATNYLERHGIINDE